jgi:hypothetical protein
VLQHRSVVLLESVAAGGVTEVVEQPVAYPHILGIEVPSASYALGHDRATNKTTSRPTPLFVLLKAFFAWDSSVRQGEGEDA